MKVFCFFLFISGVAGLCEADAPSGCKDVLQADTDGDQALELLQIKSTKDSEEHEDADEMIKEYEGETETDEDEIIEADEGAAETDEEDDASENVEEDDSEDVSVPIGKKTGKGKLCKRDRKTSCYSPRGWLGKKNLQQCNDMCAKGMKGCKMFFFGNGQCSLCKRCGKTGYRSGYNIYEKYEIEFPVKNAICKERHSSQKRLRNARGCKNRAKKTRAVAFSYKSKQCRTWKKCSATKKARGWVLQKTR
jgi:hypothetical protein